jgi:hypothetical protein
MDTDSTHESAQLPHEPTEEEFEALVAAALKVDPKGLSGKHRKTKDHESGDDA